MILIVIQSLITTQVRAIYPEKFFFQQSAMNLITYTNFEDIEKVIAYLTSVRIRRELLQPSSILFFLNRLEKVQDKIFKVQDSLCEIQLYSCFNILPGMSPVPI